MKSFYPNNSITVLISDLLFFKEGDPDEWQEIQGFDIVDKVGHDFPNLLSIFILTSDRSFAQEQAGLEQNINIRYKIKDNVGVGRNDEIGAAKFETFKDDIIESGERFLKRRLQQPKNVIWSHENRRRKFPDKISSGIEYIHLYKQHLNSSEYTKDEQAINSKAIDLIQKYLRNYDFGVKKGITHDFEFKSKIENYDVKSIRSFKQKLIARRVALALGRLKGTSKFEFHFAFCALSSKRKMLSSDESWKSRLSEFLSAKAENDKSLIDPKFAKEYKQSNQSVKNTFSVLALEEEDLSVDENILLEEILFLQQVIGLNGTSRLPRSIERGINNLKIIFEEDGIDEFLTLRVEVLNLHDYKRYMSYFIEYLPRLNKKTLFNVSNELNKIKEKGFNVEKQIMRKLMTELEKLEMTLNQIE